MKSAASSHGAKLVTPAYPYSVTDAVDRAQVGMIDKNEDPLLDSIKSLIEKQNKLIQYERMEKENLSRTLRSENADLRHQLSVLSGASATSDYSSYLTDPSSLSSSDLVDLDRSRSPGGLDRGDLQLLLRQLGDCPSVRSVNLAFCKLDDDVAEALAQLVTLDRPSKTASAGRAVGFSAVDLSFNDLGPRAAEKVFKFGVLHNNLRRLCIEGNLPMAVEPGMGAFVADICVAASGGPTAAKKAKASGSQTKTALRGGASGGDAAIVQQVLQAAKTSRLVELRLTLFDFKLTVVDQNAVLGSGAGGKKGAGKAKAAPRAPAAGKKGGKGAALPGGSAGNPMNAYAFVKGLFGVSGVAAAGGKGVGAKKPNAATAKPGKKGGKSDPVGTAGLTPSQLLGLFHLITDEDAGVFDDAIPPLIEGQALDAQVVSHASKDTLLCHAVRHNREGHVRVLLARNATPAAPNALGSTPLQLAKLTASQAIQSLLLNAMLEHVPEAGDIFSPLDPALSSSRPSPIPSIALVHARLSRETVSLLASNLLGLVSLDLTGSFIGAHGARDLAAALSRKQCKLMTLGLGGNSIGCKGCEKICDMLLINDSLTDLDLSENDIADEGAAAICRAIKSNKALESLDVGGNPICQASVLKLLTVVRSSENIKRMGGCDKLLAPVKLRRMVENNTEGRERETDTHHEEVGLGSQLISPREVLPPRRRTAGSSVSGGGSDDEEDDDEVQEIRALTRACNLQVASVAAAAVRAKVAEAGEEEVVGGGGGGWDCLKTSLSSTKGNIHLSFRFRLSTDSISLAGLGAGGGVKKPVSGYTLVVCRKRFNLKWQVVHLIREGSFSTKGQSTRDVPTLFAWKKFETDVDCLAGDEFSLWCRVEPLGKGEVGGELREWKLGSGELRGLKDGRFSSAEAWN